MITTAQHRYQTKGAGHEAEFKPLGFEPGKWVCLLWNTDGVEIWKVALHINSESSSLVLFTGNPGEESGRMVVGSVS